jgi:hypothetical protein
MAVLLNGTLGDGWGKGTGWRGVSRAAHRARRGGRGSTL